MQFKEFSIDLYDGAFANYEFVKTFASISNVSLNTFLIKKMLLVDEKKTSIYEHFLVGS